MARGRRLTTSRSERYLGSSYGYGNSQDTTSTDASEAELGEEDVWSMVDDVGDRTDQSVIMTNNSHSEWTPRAAFEITRNGNNNSNNNHGDGTRGRRHVGGLSFAFEDHRPGNHNNQNGGGVAAAAATSRIVHQQYHQRGRETVVGQSPRHQMATSAPVNVPDWSKILRVDSVESLHDSDDWYDDRDSEMIPPHEYLARDARSRKTGGASVFEGVGRTLKGRDLSRVRDAVWSETGFDG